MGSSTRGYVATGVREVAYQAGLPKGSLNNHFRSKERFGVEVLQ
ncbi:TetR/AcrR family transcriptional regulator [Rhizobium sp. SAFR-030]